jgi:hypothetical protein
VVPWVIDFLHDPTAVGGVYPFLGWRNLTKSKWRLVKGDEQLVGPCMHTRYFRMGTDYFFPLKLKKIGGVNWDRLWSQLESVVSKTWI